MMRLTTIHGLAVEHAAETGCTHDEAIVEVCSRHNLAEIPEMPVAVFASGSVMQLSAVEDRARLRRHSELLGLGLQFHAYYARLAAARKESNP